MKRKSLLLGCGLVVLLLIILAVTGVLLHHEPSFYRESEVPPGTEREKHARIFFTACGQLALNSQKNSQWGNEFTAEQINSYLAENFIRGGNMDCFLPERVSEPRVTLGDGTMRVAFRYGKGSLNSVVSLDLRVWLVPKEYNLMAVEVEGVHAGLLPISAQSMLEQVSDSLREHNRGLDLNWYRHNGHPVALLRFQADQVPPKIRLERLDLQPDKLIICGCAAEVVSAQKPQ